MMKAIQKEVITVEVTEEGMTKGIKVVVVDTGVEEIRAEAAVARMILVIHLDTEAEGDLVKTLVKKEVSEVEEVAVVIEDVEDIEVKTEGAVIPGIAATEEIIEVTDMTEIAERIATVVEVLVDGGNNNLNIFIYYLKRFHFSFEFWSFSY